MKQLESAVNVESRIKGLNTLAAINEGLTSDVEDKSVFIELDYNIAMLVIANQITALDAIEIGYKITQEDFETAALLFDRWTTGGVEKANKLADLHMLKVIG